MPAVTTLLRIHERLSSLLTNGGADAAVASRTAVADDFRNRIIASSLPFEMRLIAPSNAATYLDSPTVSAKALFLC